ncbi:MAG: hypothetical protein HY096_09600 [Nitrospinae bacterium]|nr:hypothetical protein [Nitrospinota bacterium]
MRGIPSVLNTRVDVETCHALALTGEIDSAELKKKLQDLFSDEKIWSFKSEVASTYIPLSNEKVITEIDTAGQTKYICFEFVDNPNARFLQMGFTKAELENLINQL